MGGVKKHRLEQVRQSGRRLRRRRRHAWRERGRGHRPHGHRRRACLVRGRGHMNDIEAAPDRSRSVFRVECVGRRVGYDNFWEASRQRMTNVDEPNVTGNVGGGRCTVFLELYLSWHCTASDRPGARGVTVGPATDG